MKLREFAGALNRCTEVLVPVEFSDHEEGVIWLPVKKSAAKEEILAHAKEHGIEEIHAELDPGDNCLYVEVREEGEEGEEEESEEEDSSEEEKESSEEEEEATA